MPRLLIIGIGNALRMDDDLGRRAALRLADRFANDDEVEVIDCHQLTPELAQAVAEAEEVIFLDAAVDGTPGEVNVRDLPPTDQTNPYDTHLLSPQELVDLSGRLYGKRPLARLVTLTGKHFGFGEELSSEVVRGLDRMEDEVVSLAEEGLG